MNLTHDSRWVLMQMHYASAQVRGVISPMSYPEKYSIDRVAMYGMSTVFALTLRFETARLTVRFKLCDQPGFQACSRSNPLKNIAPEC
jgi:hypothetical protein